MSARQPFRRVTGSPGETWTNETGRVWFQLKVQFRNSCGQCIQYANQIAPYWPIPFHNNCNCEQTPIRPGESSEPFVDFRKELDKMPLSQKIAAVGASNWKLIQSGKVAWEDVVQPGRIRSLREVVARKKLSADTLKGVGINKAIRGRVLAVVESPRNIARQADRTALVSALKNNGVSDQQIQQTLSGNLASKLNVAGPSGVSKITTAIPTIPTKPNPPTPPPAAVPVSLPKPKPLPPVSRLPSPLVQFIDFVIGLGGKIGFRRGKRS